MRSEILSHLVVYIIGIVVLIFTFTLPAPQSGGGDVGSYFFPQVMLITILILNTFSILVTVYKNFKSIGHVEKLSISKESVLRVSLLIILMIAYISFLPIIGYEISTGLLLILMMLIFGVKNYKILVLIPIVIVGILYIVFDTLLSIPLP